MVRLAVGFLAVALVAALAGYGGVAGHSWEGGKIVSLLALVLAALALVEGALHRRVLRAPVRAGRNPRR